jgi:hypothetical protein
VKGNLMKISKLLLLFIALAGYSNFAFTMQGTRQSRLNEITNQIDFFEERLNTSEVGIDNLKESEVNIKNRMIARGKTQDQANHTYNQMLDELEVAKKNIENVLDKLHQQYDEVFQE